jgi:RND family efflux transporter MFP subunit
MKKQFYYFLTILASMVLLGAACSQSSAESNSNSAANAADKASQAVDVTTEVAVMRNIPTYFEVTGSLASDAQTDVAPAVAGKIVEVNFDVGSYVNKGSVLVRLDPRDAQIRLEQSERQLEQARAQVEQARAAVRQAEAGVNQAKATLRQNQIRLGLTQGSNFDIETFTQVRSAKAQLEFAEKELARAEKLLATGDVSRSFRDQKLATRDQLKAQLDEGRATAAVAVKAINIAQEAVGTAQAQVGTAQANARSALAAAGTAETAVEQARKSVTDTAIYAPISGYVSERVADVGEYISPNAPNAKLCTILRTSVLRLRVDVPEQNIGNVTVGQSVSMRTSAYPDRNFAGTIARMMPNLNAASRTMVVEAEVESGGLLKPGLFATARIAQSRSESVVVVPVSAVRTDGSTSRVFVIKDGRAEERVVKTGDTENDMIEIKNGVAADERVATSNLSLLGDGIFVNQ